VNILCKCFKETTNLILQHQQELEEKNTCVEEEILGTEATQNGGNCILAASI